MTQYIISYHCETKQKIISTLHGKKIVCICRHRGCSTGSRGGVGEVIGHCAHLVEVFVKKTQSLLVKPEERVSFGLIYKPPVDQRLKDCS